jgi:hypothetical protein
LKGFDSLKSFDKLPKFFYGSTAAGGYISRFDYIYKAEDGWRAYIIKGGPGSGKSSLMKKVANEFKDDYSVTLGPCSGEPSSLDAVIINELKVCILDGTAPHIIEPKYPGICETIINMGDCWDYRLLEKNRDEILKVCKQYTALRERASRYTAAIGSLLNDNYRLALDCTDAAKAACFAASVARKEFGSRKAVKGKEAIQFLSSITPEGHIIYEDTIHSLCDRVYVLEDENCAASRIIISVLRSAALDSGLDIITCPCSITPNEKLEHLIIPSLSLAFCTSNCYHPIKKATRRIHARRFTNTKQFNESRQKIAFNRKAVKELIEQTIEIVKEANVVHNDLESYYKAAMDFSKADEYTERIISEIKERI